METHKLKTWPEYFDLILSREKTFELRKNDRNFQVGDRLDLMEWNPETKEYTGRHIRVFINHILSENPFINLGENVILSINHNEEIEAQPSGWVSEQLTADEQYVLDIAIQLLTSCKDGEVMIQRTISTDTIDHVADMIERIGINSLSQSLQPKEQPISEVTEDEWISVKDRLPEEHESVLIAMDRKDDPVYVGWLSEDKKWFEEDGPDGIAQTKDITHWKSLPPTPEKDQD